ncbi:MAG: hypothetical protein K2J29_01420, partial [Muribaculaceae bacterium]|nr:hypothetical protein [Muribaculaceae bacterium]
MKNKTYKGIAPAGLYAVREVTRLMRCSRRHLLSKIMDTVNPLRYGVDPKTKMMKFEGSELISYF